MAHVNFDAARRVKGKAQGRAHDIAMAWAASAKAKNLIREPGSRMVLLDKIDTALLYDYFDVAGVVAFLAAEKLPMTGVVLTGRNAKDALIEAADLVTEMDLVKHPFRAGVKAQQGVEY